MALKLSAPIEQEFELEEIDRRYGTDGTKVTIKQATQREHSRREELFAVMTREYREEEPGVERLLQRFSFSEMQTLEVYLTMVDCNIEDENGKPLFRKGMSEKKFTDAWGKLPPDVCGAIHRCVLEVNVDWLPSGELLSRGKESGSQDDKSSSSD